MGTCEHRGLGDGWQVDSSRRFQGKPESGQSERAHGALGLEAYANPVTRRGGRCRATEHAACAVLHDRTDPYMGAYVGREQLVDWAPGWGLDAAKIQWRGGGEVEAPGSGLGARP